MRCGFVNVSIVKVLVVGPSGVGKTSLIYLLLSKPPPHLRTSTGCAERPVQVIRISGEGGKWEEIDLKKMVAEAVPVLCERLGKMKNEMSDKVPTEQEKKGGVVESANVEGVVKGEIHEPEDTFESQFDRAIHEVMGNLIDLITNYKQSSNKQNQLVKKMQCLLERQMICVTDTGGQQAFWDLIPIFKYDTSATLFVHRLCDKLDDLPCNDLYKAGGIVGPSGQRATLTTAQAFKVMLQGLHPGETNSKIAIFGTHRDVPGEETVDTKNKRFANIVPSSFTNNMIYCGAKMNKLIFEVNSKNPTPEDEGVAEKLKEEIEKSAHVFAVPVWWYILEMVLEELASILGRQVFSKQECENVANKLGFEMHELDAALDFFDKLNIFFYKKNILPDVVFTSSQVPLDKVTELVEKQYDLKVDTNKSSNKPVEGKWVTFRDKAIITVDHLAEFPNHYGTSEGIFTAEKFLMLLKGILVVAPISKSEYFFPSLLSMVPDDKVNTLLMKPQHRVAPLLIEFSNGCAPPGVYCCMVCHLILNKSGDHELHMSRNQVTFSVDGSAVTFVDKFAYFAVCVDVCNEQEGNLERHCRDIKELLLCAIAAALKNTHHNSVDSDFAFLCPCGKNTSCTTPHPANLSRNRKKLICTKSMLVCGNLTAEQKVWLQYD